MTADFIELKCTDETLELLNDPDVTAIPEEGNRNIRCSARDSPVECPPAADTSRAERQGPHVHLISRWKESG